MCNKRLAVIYMGSIVYCINFFVIAQNECFDLVVDKITDELKTHHINLLIDKTVKKNFSHSDLVHGKLIRKIPTIALDIDATDHTYESVLRNQVYRYQKNPSLYIIVFDRDTFFLHKTEKLLRRIVDFDPSPPRPKCLVILPSEVSPLRGELFKLLEFAWRLKFLELVFLKLNEHFDMIVYDFNPFTGTYTEVNLSNRPLFYDKLQNMNGHKITMLAFNFEPYITVLNASNKIVAKGVDHEFVELLSEALNFTVSFTNCADKTRTNDMYRSLENSETNVSSMAALIGTIAFDREVLVGTVLGVEDIELIAPIIYTTDVKNLLPIFFHVCLSVVLIFIVVLSVKFFKIRSEVWTKMYIFKLLFGVSVQSLPEDKSGRFIYLCVVLISIKYSSYMFALFTENEMITNREIEFDAFEEFMKPSMPVYINDVYFPKQVREEDDKIIYHLLKNSLKTFSTLKCLEKQTKSKDRFCVTGDSYAKFWIKNHKDSNNLPSSKVALPVISFDFFAYVYEEGSPFIRKFDKKFLQLLESGIQKTFKHGRSGLKIPKKYDFLTEMDFSRDSYTVQLVILLFIGFTVSSMVFIYELMRYKNY